MYKFIFLIFLVVYVNGAYPTYDEDTAKRIFNLAASAYANVADPQGNASINACLNKSYNGTQWDLKQTITANCGVRNNNHECQSFIAVSSAINTTVLAFQGMTDLRQLWDELKDTVTDDMAVIWAGGLRVNKYFYLSMLNMWNNGVGSVVTNPKYANYTIIITGHSFGGAIASLTAYQILNTTGNSAASRIQLVTFGEPRTGDYGYANGLRTIPYIFRVVHGSDPIPHLPFCDPNSAGGCKSTSTADYYQHPQEIWYHGTTTNSIAMGSNYTSCSETDGEDSMCSDGSDLCFIFQSGGAWHANYFGHSVGDYATKYSCNDTASYAAKRSEKVLGNACGNPYPTYDEDTAKKIFSMAASAYANVADPQGNASINACLNKSFNGTQWDLKQTITVKCGVRNDNDECQAFIAVSSAINTIVLAFRGTTDLQQLWDELKDTVTNDMDDTWGGGLRVNKYFYQSMLNMWTSGVSNVVTNPQYADYKIIITGHSLGGAIASLTAYQIANMTGNSTTDRIQLVTFGEPRTGDWNYANNLRSYIPYIFRVVHGSDPIPHLPFCDPNSASITATQQTPLQWAQVILIVVRLMAKTPSVVTVCPPYVSYSKTVVNGTSITLGIRLAIMLPSIAAMMLRRMQQNAVKMMKFLAMIVEILQLKHL
uniref:Fungal lipase-like domain-containing protein n=1 Tax=Acrobeloides nanus TaxID=290746 RepID=A0A914CPT3_9BILA